MTSSIGNSATVRSATGARSRTKRQTSATRVRGTSIFTESSVFSRTEPKQLSPHLSLGKILINDFAAGELFDDAFEVSIEHDAPVIDKNDALAQRFDVLHVVTGQQDGGLASRVVVLEEFAHGFLADDIEADSWLIEKKVLVDGAAALRSVPFSSAGRD